jgi:hypothetical protein
MEGPDGTVQSTEKIVEVATNHYRDLFKFEPRPNINIISDFFSEGDKVTQVEREILEKPFSEDEIQKAVFGSYSDGAPGPDGLSFIFTRNFGVWSSRIFLRCLRIFIRISWIYIYIYIYRLNFALVTIIPKEKDARVMNKFRPISLLNCSYKIFTSLDR